MHYEHKECKILRNYRKTRMWFNVSKERSFPRSFNEWKRKKKIKKETTRNVNIKMDFKHRVPRRLFHSGRGKTGIEERSWNIYSIHFKRARLRGKGSFTILVLRYTYNSIRKHASQVWRFHDDASFVSQVCTVRGNLRVAAMKITRYNWNWLCLDL